MTSEGTREFPVGERPRVEVRIARGRVHVLSGDPGRIVVSGLDEELVVRHSGDVVIVEEERTRRRTRARDLTFAVPPQTTLDANVATADVVCSTPVREVDVKSATGQVNVPEIEVSARVRTASGDVKLGTVAGDVEVATASGDLRATRIGGRLDWATASGDAIVDEVGGELSARSASGDVVVERLLGTSAEARTVSGDLRVGLPPGRRVAYEMKSLSGRVQLPEPSGEPVAESERVRVRVRMKSVSGDAIIRTVRG